MPTYENAEYNRIVEPVPSYIERDLYDIPVIKPARIDLAQMGNGLWLCNLNNIRKTDSLAAQKIVHSFSYDKVLRAKYHNLTRFLAQTAGYYALSSFDFSMDDKMDEAIIIDRIYSNRRSGVLMQAHGRLVIPTVGWLSAPKYNLYFAGLRDGGTMIISTLGTNNLDSSKTFLSGYDQLRNRFPDTNLICVGDRVSGMDTDVCFVKYEDSFGSWNRYSNYWQPSFINWDGTTAREVL